jgi:hypothetical protein
MSNKWVDKWKIQSESNPEKFYTVSRAEDGSFGCSCPVWIFQKKTCKHIQSLAEMVLNVPFSETFITNKLMFVAKMNHMILSCNNCSHRCDSNWKNDFHGCDLWKRAVNPLRNDNLIFAKGDKKAFYVLGRCCKQYERDMSL